MEITRVINELTKIKDVGNQRSQELNQLVMQAKVLLDEEKAKSPNAPIRDVGQLYKYISTCYDALQKCVEFCKLNEQLGNNIVSVLKREQYNRRFEEVDAGAPSQDTSSWLQNEYDQYKTLLTQREEKLLAIKDLEEQMASWFACGVLAYKDQLSKENSSNDDNTSENKQPEEPVVRPNVNAFWEKRETLKKELKKVEALCVSKEFFLQKGKKLEESDMVVTTAVLSASEAEKLRKSHEETVMQEFTKETQDLSINLKLQKVVKHNESCIYNSFHVNDRGDNALIYLLKQLPESEQKTDNLNIDAGLLLQTLFGKEDLSVNSCNSHFESPLHVAIRNLDVFNVKQLLSNGALISIRSHYNKFPLDELEYHLNALEACRTNRKEEWSKSDVQLNYFRCFQILGLCIDHVLQPEKWGVYSILMDELGVISVVNIIMDHLELTRNRFQPFKDLFTGEYVDKSIAGDFHPKVYSRNRSDRSRNRWVLQKDYQSAQTAKYFELLDEWQETKDDKRRDDDSFYPRYISRKDVREIWGFDEKNYEYFFPQSLIPIKRNTMKSVWNELVAHVEEPFIKSDETKLQLINNLITEMRPIIIYHFRKHVQGYVRIINMNDKDLNGMLDCLRVRGCRCDNGSRQSHDCTSNGGRPPSW